MNCAPNDDHCGGTGGCEGSIAELAFNYTVTAGMPLEADYPYAAVDQTCTQYTPAVTCDGYTKLPVVG